MTVAAHKRVVDGHGTSSAIEFHFRCLGVHAADCYDGTVGRRTSGSASFAAACLCLAILSATACKERRSGPEPIGVVYTAPLTLNIREAIHPSSKTVATVRHGDKLDVMQTRRRFVRVRTGQGIEGWTEMRHLLSDEQMEALRYFSKNAASLPTQGQATVYDLLNMHSEPLRQSPSFYQIKEGMLVDVLAHAIAPRTGVQTSAPPPIVFRKRAPVRKTKKQLQKEEQDRKYPPPPQPKPPGLPGNWVELSKTAPTPEKPEPLPLDPKARKRKKRKESKLTVPHDDWTLVRTRDGKAGWVLSRMLRMAIPDEVAQYSEGARITSYFPLATVVDPETGETKHHWLWTTMTEGVKPHDFDSYRVFIWNLKKHRYETSYIQRDVLGYYPVAARQGPSPTFTLIMQSEDDAQPHKYTFRMEGYITRLVNKEPTMRPEPPKLTDMVAPDKQSEEEAEKSFLDRLKGIVKLEK